MIGTSAQANIVPGPTCPVAEANADIAAAFPEPEHAAFVQAAIDRNNQALEAGFIGEGFITGVYTNNGLRLNPNTFIKYNVIAYGEPEGPSAEGTAATDPSPIYILANAISTFMFG